MQGWSLRRAAGRGNLEGFYARPAGSREGDAGFEGPLSKEPLLRGMATCRDATIFIRFC